MSSKCYVSAADYDRYFARQQPEAVIVQMSDHTHWPPVEMIAIFRRLLQDGWDSGEMSDYRAYALGKKLGHYGLLELTDREVKAEGWDAVKQLGGGQ